MTLEQQRIVEENMGLVGKVIKDKVRGIGQYGTPKYDDLFQTGCVGLIKAVMTDKGGCLSTYAYRLIWNEIRDELVRNTKLTLKEQPTDTIEILSGSEHCILDPLETHDLRDILRQAKKQAPRGTTRGIVCLKLSVQGYTSQEIGAIIGADSGTVRMWMTRERKYTCSVFPSCSNMRRRYDQLNMEEDQPLVYTTGLDPLILWTFAVRLPDWVCADSIYGTYTSSGEFHLRHSDI